MSERVCCLCKEPLVNKQKFYCSSSCCRSYRNQFRRNEKNRAIYLFTIDYIKKTNAQTCCLKSIVKLFAETLNLNEYESEKVTISSSYGRILACALKRVGYKKHSRRLWAVDDHKKLNDFFLIKKYSSEIYYRRLNKEHDLDRGYEHFFFLDTTGLIDEHFLELWNKAEANITSDKVYGEFLNKELRCNVI